MVAGWPKFNQLEMVTTFTCKPSLVRIDARKFRFIVVTDPQTHAPTHTQTDRTHYNTLCHSFTSTQCKNGACAMCIRACVLSSACPVIEFQIQRRASTRPQSTPSLRSLKDFDVNLPKPSLTSAYR